MFTVEEIEVGVDSHDNIIWLSNIVTDVDSNLNLEQQWKAMNS